MAIAAQAAAASAAPADSANAKTPDDRATEFQAVQGGGETRSGTTLLHNLLGLDPRSRMPLFYEVLSPAAPVPREDGQDSRLIETRAFFKRSAGSAFDRIHPWEPDGPEECHWLFRNSFAAWTYWSSWHVPGYQAWLAKQDLAWQYQEYKVQLQLLLEQRAGDRLVLKYPFHMAYLPVLFDTFPDACVVQTHRSPAEVVGSYASFMYEARCITYGSEDRKRVLEATLDRLAFALDRNLSARASLGTGNDRVFDLRYEDLIKDPVKSVREIYECFGYPFEPAMEAAIRRWLDGNPQHKHGVHRYSLEEFGGEAGRVERMWSAYRDRFRV